MSRSNSAGSLDALELTDAEANQLARQIATERYTQHAVQHYGAYLEARARGKGPAVYDDAELLPIWVRLLRQAVLEVECGRSAELMTRLRIGCLDAMALVSPPPA